MTDEKQVPSKEAVPSLAGPLPPPSGASQTPSWAKDDKAKLEEKFWGDEDRLKGVKLKNDTL